MLFFLRAHSYIIYFFENIKEYDSIKEIENISHKNYPGWDACLMPMVTSCEQELFKKKHVQFIMLIYHKKQTNIVCIFPYMKIVYSYR
jgi:hypothetical protein